MVNTKNVLLFSQIWSRIEKFITTLTVLCNSYTMAVGVYVSKIPSSHGTSDIYHLGHTHLIGERTNENSSHLFYTVASEDRLWF